MATPCAPCPAPPPQPGTNPEAERLQRLARLFPEGSPERERAEAGAVEALKTGASPFPMRSVRLELDQISGEEVGEASEIDQPFVVRSARSRLLAATVRLPLGLGLEEQATVQVQCPGGPRRGRRAGAGASAWAWGLRFTARASAPPPPPRPEMAPAASPVVPSFVRPLACVAFSFFAQPNPRKAPWAPRTPPLARA